MRNTRFRATRLAFAVLFAVAAIAANAQDDGAPPPAEGDAGEPPVEEVTAAPESEQVDQPVDVDTPPAEEAAEVTEAPSADELPPDEPTEVDVPAGEVVVLSDDTFDAVSGQYDVMFVNFYADWCRFSQMLKPIFAAAARQVSGLANVRMGSINCEGSDTEVTREKYHISKYPTIKVFRRGVALKSEYRGQRSPHAMEAYIQELLRTAVAHVDTEEQVNDLVSQAHRAMVAHFNVDDHPAAANFNKIGNEQRDECHFVQWNGAENLPESNARLYYKDDHNEVTYDGDILDHDAVFAWSREHCNPIVREITFENGEELTEEGLPFLIMFFDPAERHHVAEFTRVIKERFAHERGVVNFITADGTKFSHPLRHLGKTKADLPILAFDTFKHMYLFKRFSRISKPGKLESFMSDYHNGKLHHNFHHPSAEQDDDNDDAEQTEAPHVENHPDDATNDGDNKVDTLKEKLEVAEDQKRPDVPEELKTTDPPAHMEEHDEHDDPSKPVPVKSVLKHLKPSENRYSFAHSDEL